MELKEKRSHIVAIDRGNGKYSGLEKRYHPILSGRDRWVDGYGDNRMWESPDIAIDEMKKLLRSILVDDTLANNNFSGIIKAIIRNIEGVV